MSFIAPGPDQQRVGRIRRALVAVAAALDDQAQIVVAGEIDRGDDVRRGLGGDGIDARRRRPRIDPAGGLRRAGLVANVVRISQVLQHVLAGCAVNVRRTGGKRRLHLHQASRNSRIQGVPTRRIRPGRIPRTHAAERGIRRRAGGLRPRCAAGSHARHHRHRRCLRQQTSSVHPGASLSAGRRRCSRGGEHPTEWPVYPARALPCPHEGPLAVP